MKKAFLDLDGTLLDSKLRHKRVLEDIFYVCTGISDIDVADFVDYKADGNNTKKYLMNKFLLPEGDADILSKGWTEHIEDLDYLAGDNWYFDSMLFVKCLKESDYCNIIVTARQNEEAVIKFVEESLLAPYIDNIYVADPMNAATSKIDIINNSSQIIYDDIYFGCYGTKLGFDGNAYGIPGDGAYVWRLNLDNLLPTPVYDTKSDLKAKYAGGCVALNGKIYGVPADSNNLLEIDYLYEDVEVSYVEWIDKYQDFY